MVRNRIWHVLAVALALAASAGAYAVEDNCANCHAESPLGDGHPPVEMKVANCSMCHQNNADDKYFNALHSKHSSMGCAMCHGADATPELEAKLKELLGG